jgi:hypothetical protein
LFSISAISLSAMLVQREHFLFADAEQIVVVGRALDDGAGGAFHAGGVIHQHGRVARAGADGAFARLHGRLDHAGAAGDAQQPDVLIGAQRLERIQRRMLDDAAKVFDAGFARDGLIVGANGQRRATRGGRMRVENHGVAGRHHVDDVAAERGNGMGRGRDRADDAKRRVFLQRDAVIAAAAVGPEPFDAGNVLDDLQLFDFVIEPADFRFLQFNAAPFGGIGLGQCLDNVDDLLPRGHAALLAT